LDGPRDHGFKRPAENLRSDEGILQKSTGTSFTDFRVREATFTDANGFSSAHYYYNTIQYPDLNSDGKADVCGRGSLGIYCAISNSNDFTGLSLWSNYYSDANGFTDHQYYSTLQFVNLNGDGYLDICARRSTGLLCALGTGSAFGSVSLWSTSFSSSWAAADHYSTIRFADVDNDGRDDVCGRGDAGIYCAKSTGTSFGTPTLWSTAFRNTDGGDQAQYYKTLSFKDIDNDGRADLCGRGVLGHYCGTSNGGSFNSLVLVAGDFSDTNGWNQAKYYETIDLADVNGDGYLGICGRGAFGVWCRD